MCWRRAAPSAHQRLHRGPGRLGSLGTHPALPALGTRPALLSGGANLTLGRLQGGVDDGASDILAGPTHETVVLSHRPGQARAPRGCSVGPELHPPRRTGAALLRRAPQHGPRQFCSLPSSLSSLSSSSSSSTRLLHLLPPAAARQPRSEVAPARGVPGSPAYTGAGCCRPEGAAEGARSRGRPEKGARRRRPRPCVALGPSGSATWT